MFMIVIQQRLFNEQNISNPLQFYIHQSEDPHINILTRVKKMGFRGFILILIVSQSILSNFIIGYKVLILLLTKYRICQQKQMFDYNRQQNSIEGVFRPRSLNIQHNNLKLDKEFDITESSSPTFIKKIQFKNTKINPFLEMEQQQKMRPEFVNELDFSIIQLKSPSTSQFYNSLGNQKFFPSTPHQFSKKIDLDQNESKIFDRFQQVKFTSAYKIQKQLHQVPTFFIKMPEYFKGQRMSQKKQHRKKLQQELNQQLEDIYRGKYKIEWKPENERY